MTWWYYNTTTLRSCRVSKVSIITSKHFSLHLSLKHYREKAQCLWNLLSLAKCGHHIASWWWTRRRRWCCWCGITTITTTAADVSKTLSFSILLPLSLFLFSSLRVSLLRVQQRDNKTFNIQTWRRTSWISAIYTVVLLLLFGSYSICVCIHIVYIYTSYKVFNLCVHPDIIQIQVVSQSTKLIVSRAEGLTCTKKRSSPFQLLFQQESNIKLSMNKWKIYFCWFVCFSRVVRALSSPSVKQRWMRDRSVESLGLIWNKAVCTIFHVDMTRYIIFCGFGIFDTLQLLLPLWKFNLKRDVAWVEVTQFSRRTTERNL